MAITTGNSGIVKVGSADDTEAALGSLRSFSIETSADTVDKTVMGDVARSYIKSFATGTVQIEAYWDEADAVMQSLDERADVFFEIYPSGETANLEHYTGSGIVTSKSISASFDGMVEASFTIQINGTTGGTGVVVATVQ